MPAGTGYSSGATNVYQQAIATLLGNADSTVNDGNSATGPDISNSPPVSTTGLVDLGSDQLISDIDLVTGYQGNLTRALQVALSASPTLFSSVGCPPSSNHSGLFSTVSDSISGLSVTGRYVRYSAQDDNGRVSIREIDVTATAIPPPARRPAMASFI